MKEGGSFSSNQLAMMVVSTAMQMMGVPLWALMMMTTAVSEAGSDRGIRLGDVLEAGAIAYATAEVLPAANFSGMGSNLIGANAGATLQNIGTAVVQVGEHSAVTAGIQTALGGGSFASAFEANAIMDIAAIGAGAIGANVPGGSFESIGLHALLGCASSTALGTGCAGGAIGGATSALVTPLTLGAMDPNHEPLTLGQTALATAISTLAGGSLAGLLGQNPLGGATAAANEVENNGTKHWVSNLAFCILCFMGVQSGSDNAFSASTTPFSDDPSLGVSSKDELDVDPLPKGTPFGQKPK